MKPDNKLVPYLQEYLLFHSDLLSENHFLLLNLHIKQPLTIMPKQHNELFYQILHLH